MDYRENGVKFAQTTKGIWYCEEIAVSTDDVMQAVDLANKVMVKTNKILGARNRYKTQQRKETEHKE
jgi:hypothetical protein